MLKISLKNFISVKITEPKLCEYFRFPCVLHNYVISLSIGSANVGYLELLVDDEDGNDIGDSLIRRGLALPRTEHVFPTKLLLVD